MFKEVRLIAFMPSMPDMLSFLAASTAAQATSLTSTGGAIKTSNPGIWPIALVKASGRMDNPFSNATPMGVRGMLTLFA